MNVVTIVVALLAPIVVFGAALFCYTLYLTDRFPESKSRDSER